MVIKMNRRSPNIRFYEFNKDWEQRKLGDFTKLITKGTTPKDKSGKGTINFVKVENVNNGKIYPVNKIYEEEHENYLKRSKLKENDILFSIAGTLGRTAVVDKSILPANTNQALAIIRKYDFETDFLLTSLSGKAVTDFIRKNPTVGAQPNLSLEQVGKLEIWTPQLEEQQKVGSFFKQLDNTLALHQQLLNDHKQLKKAMLQKMFPQKGESVPRLRFANFTDDWEQLKLSDISEKITEKNRKRKYTETLTNSAEHGIISQSDYFDKTISNIKNIDGYYIVEPDNFVYNPRISNFAPVGPIKRNNLKKIGVMSPLYYVFKIHDVDPSFLENYFDTSYWHEFMKLNGDSGARADRFAIKDSVFKEMPIPYTNINEQEKIGNFFKQLDETIVLYEKKLKSYQELKKVMLQKMFV